MTNLTCMTFMTHFFIGTIFYSLFPRQKILIMKKTLGLALLAAAAYGLYKYSKLSPSEKENLMSKGKDLLDKKLGLGNLFNKKQTA